MCRSFCQAGKLLSAEISKMTEFHIWANQSVMLRQPCVLASMASPARSRELEGGFIPKTFLGLHFLFSGAFS